MFKTLSKQLQKLRYFGTKPEYTKKSYKLTRGAYSTIKEDDLTFFEQLLGPNNIVTDPIDLERYNIDFFKFVRGCSEITLKPKTRNQISEILKYCNKRKLAVVPQGGHTGVVGAGTPIFDEIVISMEGLNKILDFDEISGILTCESGCVLQTLNMYVSPSNYIIPLDLGAKGSCQIGGNVSTNAGGLRLLKYGNLHGTILGLEVVKADGTVLDCLSTLKKNNTGYHLKNLFIGAEGTLGLVTKVAIQCHQQPKTTLVAFLGCQSFDKVLKTFRKSKTDLDEILTACEVMDAGSLELIYDALKIRSPIGQYPFYVLIEVTGSDGRHNAEKLERFLEEALNQTFILNGTVTSDSKKIDEIWHIREKIPYVMRHDGYCFTYDFSVPLDTYYKLVEDTKEALGSNATRIYGFGHLGDGNIHLHIAIKEWNSELHETIESYVISRVLFYNGSISAEHGIGILKAKYLSMARSKEYFDLMRSIKQTMDPNNILNPYKIFNI